MLQVVQLPLGPYATNCYLAAPEGAGEAIVVDPGDEADVVLAALAERGWRADGILVTHGHWDHLGAVAAVARETGAEVWMPRAEAGALRRLEAGPHEPEHLLDGGERLHLAGVELETFLCPGHSPGAIAYAGGGVLFGGDVLFAGSIGRTDLEGGDLGELLAGIERLASALPHDTPVLPGHGPVTTLAAELRANPHLGLLRR